MQLVANNFKVVSKSSQTWKNGDVSYRLQIGGGEGGLLTVNVPKEVFDNVVPFDTAYDAVINVDTVGYKHYVELIQIFTK